MLVVSESPALLAGVGALLAAEDVPVVGVARTPARLGAALHRAGATAVVVATLVVATVLGWGLVTNASAGWLAWQGYLLGPLGLGGRDGAWAYANVGVLAALVIGFVVTLVASRRRVRAQESTEVEVGA